MLPCTAYYFWNNEKCTGRCIFGYVGSGYQRQKVQYKEKGLKPEEILANRKEEYPEILESIRSLALDMQSRYLPSGKAGKAVTYLLNQWEPLTFFMKDGRIPLSNNIAEREGIKPLVMARKNFLFADTVRGAEASMVWFSLMISAKINHLNPEKYLEYVLTRTSSGCITDELISELLPYSKNLPESIKVA